MASLPRRNINNSFQLQKNLLYNATNPKLLGLDGSILLREALLTNPNTIKQHLSTNTIIPWSRRYRNIRELNFQENCLSGFVGNPINFLYKHSNVLYTPSGWNDFMRALKIVMEDAIAYSMIPFTDFTHAICHKYLSGHNSHVAYSEHTDYLNQETDFVTATLYLSHPSSRPRKIVFQNIHSKESVTVKVKHNTVLLMKNNFHKNWRQYIPKEKNIGTDLIAITFLHLPVVGE